MSILSELAQKPVQHPEGGLIAKVQHRRPHAGYAQRVSTQLCNKRASPANQPTSPGHMKFAVEEEINLDQQLR